MTARVYPAQVVSVHDGDTVTLMIDLGMDVWRFAPVRLAGINARELSQAGGREARAHLLDIIPIGSYVTLTSLRYDKFGNRIDGLILTAEGRDVSTTMVADGYAIAWDGRGPKPIPPWPIP